MTGCYYLTDLLFGHGFMMGCLNHLAKPKIVECDNKLDTQKHYCCFLEVEQRIKVEPLAPYSYTQPQNGAGGVCVINVMNLQPTYYSTASDLIRAKSEF